jgi:3-methylcrotonyl-CoA carboxylase alpha subunit
MDTRLRFADRTLTVTLEGAPDVRAARVDERTLTLEAWRLLGRTSVAAFDVHELVLDVGGRRRRALVARRGERLVVALDGEERVYELALADAAAARGEHATPSGAVAAPMPGKVVSVAVAVGDEVEAGQVVVVLEAMKMETGVTSPGAGTVTAVHVAAGDTVDAGAVLVDVS